MQYRIIIDCDNAAFGENPISRARELARMLRVAVGKLEAGTEVYSGWLYDMYGNRVGEAELVE